MGDSEQATGKGGAGLTEDVGALKELTDLLTKEETKCQEDKDEVGSWITAIGKAIFAIFK